LFIVVLEAEQAEASLGGGVYKAKGYKLFSCMYLCLLEKNLLFYYLYSMQVVINSRNNGACPLCTSNENCRVQDTLAGAVNDFSSEEDPMELVIYSCPQFQEKLL
jgi:hypothetical protein